MTVFWRHGHVPSSLFATVRTAMCKARAVICVLLSGMGAALAAPKDMTVDRLFGICEAQNVGEASAKGDELGWRRLSDAETEEWRTGFVAYNGGSVELVGWRREAGNGEDYLSFWIASGPNAHTACTWSTTATNGLVGELSERLGEPDLHESGAIDMISAWWTRGDRDYSFTQIGSSAMIAIGPSP